MKKHDLQIVSVLCIIFLVFIYNKSSGGIMDLKILLGIDKPLSPIRVLDKIPVYPMAHEILLNVSFTNNGPDDLVLEDPDTSQKLLLWIINKNEGEWMVYEVNPGSIDITGEITAPVTNSINIPLLESKNILIDLYRYCKENCFFPGKYELYVEFMDVKSEPMGFAVEFHQGSVPVLIETVLNEEDSWIRETSLLWINELPKKPDLELNTENMTEVETGAIKQRNEVNAKMFLLDWANEKDSKIMEVFFKDVRLK